MHSRPGFKRMGSRGVWLFLGWTGKDTTKSLSFAPRLKSLLPKASELVCYLHDDEGDHSY
jgi:hypothetical protein